ncbi:unnamed protein product [Sphagnum tenellum]
MKEEITDADDYADWIRWVIDVEQGKQALLEAANGAKMSVLLQVQQMDIMTLTTASRSNWLTIARQIRGGERFAKDSS